jgi:hypothetical protein
VLILVFHYHIAHDPTKDPFDKSDISGEAPSRNPRPNPIDVVYLGFVSRISARLSSDPNLLKGKACRRLEAVFIEVSKLSPSTSYLR